MLSMSQYEKVLRKLRRVGCFRTKTAHGPQSQVKDKHKHSTNWPPEIFLISV